MGAHLLAGLASGHEPVRALRRKDSDLEKVRKVFGYFYEHPRKAFKAIEWLEGDVTDPWSLRDAMEDIRQVYHCAGLVSFDPADRKKMLAVNVEGTAHVVSACLEQGVKKLCHVSSTAALGGSTDGEVVTEEHIWPAGEKHPLYGWTKFLGEMEVWQGITEGLNAVVVNPSIIIGPGFWKGSSGRLFSTVSKGMKYYPPGTAGYADVRDTVKTMRALMDGSHSGERYIVSAENVSYRELFNMIAHAVGNKLPRREVRPWMITLAATLDRARQILTGSRRLITRETGMAGMRKTRFSNRKIRQATGIEYMPVSESIQYTAKIFLRENQSQ